MKAGAQSAESEALQWAIVYFRERADKMDPENSKRMTVEKAAGGFLLLWDSPQSHAKAAEDLDIQIAAARGGEEISVQLICQFAAALMERSEPLPHALRDFIVEFLRRPTKYHRKPGVGAHDKVIRDITIWRAVDHIVKTWGFSATRNPATERASASSIAREAIKKGVRLHLSEDAVVKAFKKTRPDGEKGRARYQSSLSEKIPPD